MMSGITDLSLQLVAQLVDVSIRSLCLAFIAFAVIRAARARSAAARHAIWSVVLGAMLVLPVLAPLVPPIAVKIAPRAFLPASASQPGDALAHPRSSSSNRTVTQTPPTPAPPRWPALLAALYLTAALGFLARLLVGFRLSGRLLLGSQTVRNQRALDLLQDLAAAHSSRGPCRSCVHHARLPSPSPSARRSRPSCSPATGKAGTIGSSVPSWPTNWPTSGAATGSSRLRHR